MPPHAQLDIPSLLHRIPLFSELSDSDIQLVARYPRDRHIARGEMLFQRGDQPLDLADRLQTPVFVMTDLDIGLCT